MKNAGANPLLMTFDKAKIPQFAPAPPGYSVIPPDYGVTKLLRKLMGR